MYCTRAVQSYDNNMVTIMKTSTLFIWRNLFHIAFGMKIQNNCLITVWYSQKKKKDVMFPLSKNKVQLVVTITSVISSKKGDYSEVTIFEGRYFFWRKGVTSFSIC